MSIAPQTVLPGYADFPPVHLPVRRITVDEYHHMLNVGILKSGDPIELIEGILVTKMTKHPPHTSSTESTCEALDAALPAGWFIRSQEPLSTRESEPEPDAMIVRGSRKDYVDHHPTPSDVALVVEVADDSLARDRGAKKRLYARAKIPVYWIVNLVDRQIEVYTDPTGPADLPDYRHVRIFGESESVPLEIEGKELVSLRVQDVLP